MDFVFKRIFGQDDTKDSLLSLLNAILNGNPHIKDLTVLNTETLMENPNNKASRLDIEVKTDKGIYINVEMQCVATLDLYSRSVVYASHLVTNNTIKGESYDKPKVISIWIIRDEIKHGPVKDRKSPVEEISYCFVPNNIEDKYNKFDNKSRIIWVQISKFKDIKIREKINKILQEWIMFFEDPNKVRSKDKGISKAVKLFEKLSSPEQKRAQIRAVENYERDKESEKAIERERGKEEGKLEKMKELALNMKSQGFDNEIIAKCLRIDVDNLNKLLNN